MKYIVLLFIAVIVQAARIIKEEIQVIPYDYKIDECREGELWWDKREQARNRNNYDERKKQDTESMYYRKDSKGSHSIIQDQDKDKT